eukprot:COSAG01_NODE_8345_length_2821_cov_11.207568_6_plen_88_part_01
MMVCARGTAARTALAVVVALTVARGGRGGRRGARGGGSGAVALEARLTRAAGEADALLELGAQCLAQQLLGAQEVLGVGLDAVTLDLA